MLAIKGHWHAVASELDAILPKSGGRYRAHFEDLVATIVCSKFPGEMAVRFGGTEVPVVPLLQTTPDDPPVYWLGWFEQWRSPSKPARNKLQFSASAMTVYYGAADRPKRQILRAEWSGVLNEKAGIDVFQSPGSAHPHWHVDGIKSYFVEIQEGLDRQVRAVAQDAKEFVGDPKSVTSVEFGTEVPIYIPNASELCWTGVHFAVEANWSEIPWSGPDGLHDSHARGPADLKQIRAWLTSCARYLQAEIQAQLLRARRR